VRTQSPAAIVVAATTGSTPMLVASSFLSVREMTKPRELPTASVAPLHSPPERASILRI